MTVLKWYFFLFYFQQHRNPLTSEEIKVKSKNKKDGSTLLIIDNISLYEDNNSPTSKYDQ